MRKIIETDIPKVKKLLQDVLATDTYQHIARMGGLTNHTYQVVLENGQNYVIRLPGEGTEELINRADEKVSTELACRLGIDAPLLYFGDRGEKITRYIDGARTMCADSFADEDILRKVAHIFRVLHTSGVDTKVSFDVFDTATGYERIIQDNSVALFEDYAEVKALVMKIQEHVNQFETKAVPCHNDPLCENWVLDKGGKLHLIDWEYAGMNDGMWDLADVSVEAGLSDDQDHALLLFYLDGEPKQDEALRFYANKLYLDFLWALWGKARVPFDGEPMEAYGQERFTRLRANLDKFLQKFPIV